ncbi:MAG: 50S ribosomal protein L24 [Legionellales bacterium]|nr:50S ribosomal protein L24 [Legionellales bacterium]|tara:strand:+ start:5741 stop:6088 length:348 start_codon:yes stop_codon:yes gene_type:complete
MQKLKKGDEVVVTAGKDKGRRGAVLSIMRRKVGNKTVSRVLVDGVNMMKKHMRGNPNTGEKGGIVEKAAPLDISNVAVWNPMTQKGDRVGIKQLENGKRARYFKSNGELVDISEA